MFASVRSILWMCLTVGVVTRVAAEAIPLPEHPRPDWERPEWVNLNGTWDFAVKEGVFDRKIAVPSSWAAPASGVKGCAKVDVAWYRRQIRVPESWKGKRVFVVVGASDRATDGYIDGQWVGRWADGYTPFEFEFTRYVKWGREQTLSFRVDDTPHDWVLYGKQGYGDCRGIWQTVYLEARADDYLDYVHFTPLLAQGAVRADVRLAAPARRTLNCTFSFAACDRAEPFTVKIPVSTMEASAVIPLPKPHLWDLDDPYLYELEVSLTGGERVRTYFGMREFSVVKLPGTDIPYPALNGKPVYLRMALDQCYHKDGFYTWPSDEFMRRDIAFAREIGLNGLREHIKVEFPRKLYWADRLGVLLQADVPNWWGPPVPEAAQAHRFCLEQMIRRDYNHPAIFSWLLYNELWGLQTECTGADGKKEKKFLEPEMRLQSQEYLLAKKLDPTRLIEDDHCHTITDIDSWHGYCPWWKWEDLIRTRSRDLHEGSPCNFGGRHVQGPNVPMMNSECGNVWGYKGSAADSDWSWDYHGMMNAFRKYPQCAGWIYTEHHDVINEWNGYLRFDRTCKVTGIEQLFPGMRLNDLHGDAYVVLPTEPGRFYAPGETVTITAGVSLMTAILQGQAPSLSYSLRYVDGHGCQVESPLQDIPCRVTALGAWCYEPCLAQAVIRMPADAACGTVNFTLKAGGIVRARNFCCFAVDTGKDALVRPMKSSWSEKCWEEISGEKQCGTGKGFFEYEFPVPSGEVTFFAEVSAKRLNGKDVGGLTGGTSEWEAVRGGGWTNPSNHANSYAMTDEDAWSGAVRVVANGTFLATVSLPDDPADHRGILSWLAQKRDGYLRDAGSYGYLVKVRVPAAVAMASEDGKLHIRLEANTHGLAVYGPRFGRYPFGPHVTGTRGLHQ